MRSRRRRLAAALVAAPLLALTTAAATAVVVLPSAGVASATLTARAQSTIAAPALTFARAQLGKPYQWGGTGPAAYDCSGLVYAAYQRAGLRLPRTSQDMYDHLPHVRRAHWQPGDLIFFGTLPAPSPSPSPSPSPTPSTSPSPSPSPSPTSSPTPSPEPDVYHVGLYIGDDQMINSPKTGDVVKVESVVRSDLLPIGARPARKLAFAIGAGQTGYRVTQVQRLLAYWDSTVAVDGDYGSDTKAAVARFQTAKGMDPTGGVGLPTWQALVKAEGGKAAAAIGNAPEPPPAGSTEREQMVAPYRDTVLVEGDTGKAVKVLQQLLGGLAVDGDFGPKTKAAVNAYKSAHGLKPNGVVGRGTWDALAQG